MLNLQMLRLTASVLWLGAIGACSSGSSAPVTLPLTLSGTALYEDRSYDQSGFTAALSNKPVRHARVELLDPHGTVWASGSSDANGFYSLSGELPVEGMVRVYASSAATSTVQTSVAHPGDGALYAMVKNYTATGPLLTLNLFASAGSGAGGPFNIYDVYRYAGEFYTAQHGSAPPPLNTFWAADAPYSSYGTYTCPALMDSCPQGAGIYILGVANDTDEYDDDVLWHEYGHFMEFTFGSNDSRGGTHYINDERQDLRLAWSEGWSNFISGAVKDWLGANVGAAALSTTLPSGTYVDTNSYGAIYYDFAAQTLYAHASSEAAVAKVLWGNHADFGMPTLWSIFSGYLPGNGINATLEAHWDGWVAQLSPDAALQGIFRARLSERGIDYSADSAEGDNDLASATPIPLGTGGAQNHTLFRDGTITDEDWFSFPTITGNSYRIETFGLLNGTDTYIELYDDAVTALGNNDNRTDTTDYATLARQDSLNINDGCTFASRLQFSAGGGTHYIRVRNSPYAPLSTGHYGSYTIRVLENPDTTATACP